MFRLARYDVEDEQTRRSGLEREIGFQSCFRLCKKQLAAMPVKSMSSEELPLFEVAFYAR
jgi:hypothetical protein